MRNKFGEVLIKLFKDNDSLYFVTADAGNGVFQKYADEHPSRYINVGIAEQNMAGVAAGMAMMGKTVIVNSIGNFPILRCYEQIRNDAAYHNLNVKVCTTGGGLSYGPAGVTHHATEDFSVMRAMPGVVCFAPGDSYEVEACTRLMINTPGTCYMRIGYKGEKNIHKEAITDLKVGEALKILDGYSIAILTAGSILGEGYKAAMKLNEVNISAALYSFPTIKPIDANLIRLLASHMELIITMEENVLEGGFGSAVAEVMAQIKNPRAYIRMIGLNNEFPAEIGDHQYLRDYYHINAKRVLEVVEEHFKSDRVKDEKMH